MVSVIFKNVSFGYNEILLKNINCHFDKGWTAVVGANGNGKTTILLLIADKLMVSDGAITKQDNVIYCPQRTDTVPEFFEELLKSSMNDACKIKGKLQIGDDWLCRWTTLSHGERKRAQIATALWMNPSILAVDEPTNHLDQTAKSILVEALNSFNGTGVIVSHDRHLLNQLPYQCLFVEPPDAVMRKGIFKEANIQKELDEEYAREEKKILHKKIKQLKTDAMKKRNLASRAHRIRSKRGVGAKDSDAKTKIDLARMSGKDGVYGKLLNQMQGRIKQEEDRLKNVKVKKERSVKYKLKTSKTKSKFLFKLEDVTLTMGAKVLKVENFVMRPGERIAITGSNGSGKSTLINHIVNHEVNKTVLYIPQEITVGESSQVIESIRSLSNEEKGKIITIVGSLGSDPKRVLYSDEPTPGEVRKLMLALGILKEPVLIVMDEPTNHMDLPSAICLGQTLKESDAGILLVSHDREFLDSIVTKEWRLVADNNYEIEYAIEEINIK